MADRMTATREALALLHLDEDEQDAALAEVEEWEARADTLEHDVARITEYARRVRERADTLERERDEARSQRDYETAKMQAAEARAEELQDQVTSMTLSVQVIQNERAKAEARADTLEAALNVIDRRADDALAALFGIADNNEARPRVARALTAIQQIREALTPDEPSAFPEEGCVCMECEAARAALGGNEK